MNIYYILWYIDMYMHVYVLAHMQLQRLSCERELQHLLFILGIN